MIFGIVIYKVGLKVYFNEEDFCVFIMCWGSCVYII